MNYHTMNIICGIGLFCLLLPLSILFAENGSQNGYNSLEGGLEHDRNNGTSAKIYNMRQITGLRRAVSPRYIRVINFQNGGGQRSLEKGILFTIEAYRSRNVYISGSFNNWSTTPLYRGRAGVFYRIIPVREKEAGDIIEDYQYKFQVDGIWQHDATNPNVKDDGLGGYISLFHLRGYDAPRQISVRVLREKTIGRERLVEFAIYLPEIKNLSLVADFNNWNPEHDLMQKGLDGVFRLRKRLRPGTYLYKFVADGRWILDKFNQETRFHTGIQELTSCLILDATKLTKK